MPEQTPTVVANARIEAGLRQVLGHLAQTHMRRYNGDAAASLVSFKQQVERVINYYESIIDTSGVEATSAPQAPKIVIERLARMAEYMVSHGEWTFEGAMNSLVVAAGFRAPYPPPSIPRGSAPITDWKQFREGKSVSTTE